MTVFRLISLPAHAVAELLGGIALLVAPFVLGFGTTATVVAIVAGIALVGLGVGAADSMPLNTHIAFDWALVIGLLAAALGVSAAGDRTAGLAFVAAAVAQVILVSVTRWTRGSLRPI